MKQYSAILILLILGCIVGGVFAADANSTGKGTLKISSNPAGAAVYMDSEYKGITPEAGYITIPDLATKTYAITVKRPGYLDYITSAGIVANQTVTVSADLTPAPEPAGTTPTSNIIIGVLIVIVIVLLVAFVVLRRRKPAEEEKKKEKIELD